MRLKYPLYLLFFLIISLLLSCSRQKGNQIELNQNWQFRQTGSEDWTPAAVPGCIHTDLMDNKTIPDPFFGDNENKLQWIGESDWDYRTTFDVAEMLDYENTELVFNGIDTYAEIYLNDSLILTADNMFRQWVIDIKKWLRPGRNNLMIHFKAPEKIEKEKAAQLPYLLPDSRGFTRKAPYQYGWDWGPKFITMGIWQPVFFRAWNGMRIEGVHVSTKEINEDNAVITVEAEITSTKDENAEIEIQIEENKFSKKISLRKGNNNFNKELTLSNPRIWWPNGMGDHPLYELNLQVKTTGF